VTHGWLGRTRCTAFLVLYALLCLRKTRQLTRTTCIPCLRNEADWSAKAGSYPVGKSDFVFKSRSRRERSKMLSSLCSMDVTLQLRPHSIVSSDARRSVDRQQVAIRSSDARPRQRCCATLTKKIHTPDDQLLLIICKSCFRVTFATAVTWSAGNQWRYFSKPTTASSSGSLACTKKGTPLCSKVHELFHHLGAALLTCCMQKWSSMLMSHWTSMPHLHPMHACTPPVMYLWLEVTRGFGLQVDVLAPYCVGHFFVGSVRRKFKSEGEDCGCHGWTAPRLGF